MNLMNDVYNFQTSDKNLNIMSQIYGEIYILKKNFIYIYKYKKKYVHIYNIYAYTYRICLEKFCNEVLF